VEIRVPPLRERSSDVPILARHFLKKFSYETGRRIEGFTDAAVEKLQQHHWPGNVRELRNVVERAVALSAGATLDAADIWITSLDVGASGQFPTVFKPISLEEMEKRQIQLTLNFADWNKSRTAEILGIERSTLDRKIKSYELRREG
jgi:Nif-specific regulatory protein